MNTGSSWRYTTLGILLSALAFFIIVQMLRIQLSPQAEALREKGELYSGTWRTITPARGQIYDRRGNLLAGNRTVYEVGVILEEVENPSTIALALNAVVDTDYDEVFSAASTEPSGDAIYATLARFVTEEQKQRLDKLAEEMQLAYGDSKDGNKPSLAGLTFDPRLQRSYPEKDLASNILGFVNWEGEGFFGVEEAPAIPQLRPGILPVPQQQAISFWSYMPQGLYYQTSFVEVAQTRILVKLFPGVDGAEIADAIIDLNTNIERVDAVDTQKQLIDENIFLSGP